LRNSMVQPADDATLARSAVRSLDDPERLRQNPLLLHLGAHHAHEDVRACVVRALDALERKDPYLHAIVVRADVHGEANKSIFTSIGRSRRQFYRERHEALTLLAHFIRESAERLSAVAVEALPDANDVREQLIDMLGSCGQYDAAYSEALALA